LAKSFSLQVKIKAIFLKKSERAVLFGQKSSKACLIAFISGDRLLKNALYCLVCASVALSPIHSITIRDAVFKPAE